jgi:hypothetical protein
MCEGRPVRRSCWMWMPRSVLEVSGFKRFQEVPRNVARTISTNVIGTIVILRKPPATRKKDLQVVEPT